MAGGSWQSHLGVSIRSRDPAALADGAFEAICRMYLEICTRKAVRPGIFQEADHRLSAAIQTYWINFARTGDPNGRGVFICRVTRADPQVP